MAGSRSVGKRLLPAHLHVHLCSQLPFIGVSFNASALVLQHAHPMCGAAVHAHMLGSAICMPRTCWEDAVAFSPMEHTHGSPARPPRLPHGCTNHHTSTQWHACARTATCRARGIASAGFSPVLPDGCRGMVQHVIV